MDNSALLETVLALRPGVITNREKADRAAVTVPVGELLATLTALKSRPELDFDQLIDHTAVDWPQSGKIELFYLLRSSRHGHMLFVTTLVDRDAAVAPSVCSLWRIAEWQEREVFDLFGVSYSSHPDLRRLFLEDDWVGHPLRKDYQDAFMLERPWGRS